MHLHTYKILSYEAATILWRQQNIALEKNASNSQFSEI